MVGIANLKDIVSDEKKYFLGRNNIQYSFLEGFENKDAIKENSPVKRAKELCVALFLAHGSKDVRGHYDHFKRVKRASSKTS